MVPDTPRHWIIQALQKNAFNANAAVEWLFANTSVLDALDKVRPPSSSSPVERSLR